MMNMNMYDPQQVAARLAARRVQLAQEKKPITMTKRYALTDEEMTELRELIAGGADEGALGAFAQRCNVHGSSMRRLVRGIRQELAAEASPPATATAVASVVVAPPAPPPAATAVAPAARIEGVVEWLTALRAMRDELREHGVLVEGSVRITVDL